MTLDREECEKGACSVGGNEEKRLSSCSLDDWVQTETAQCIFEGAITFVSNQLKSAVCPDKLLNVTHTIL